ncbi:hypothetical protein PIB30_013851 [Stylosanthes scabra]|uniref:Uncharacterized protein n=1 Tax=Stylosanthes scabra TaxID=79078 RepID=A0ABU6T7D4_9FABA|nr:hypothetical protein [Stylosanthes scabra]
MMKLRSKDRKRSRPSQGSSGMYNRWLSGASTGPVENGYYNRPGELILAYRTRHTSFAFRCEYYALGACSVLGTQ